jgi:hypothetical protein
MSCTAACEGLVVGLAWAEGAAAEEEAEEAEEGIVEGWRLERKEGQTSAGFYGGHGDKRRCFLLILGHLLVRAKPPTKYSL